ncbi:BAR-domain-containing protein [Aulographum hederae CBS 113979]|uniref:BAR-domain-containing protein n=1 Tax=Aulographum hederae CBS 113979 TaxID=1176131 RepID=A0A6G1H080_9PEZI|nr:BAR-domain-containing protein [Aulographum hederae CBS 113979]
MSWKGFTKGVVRAPQTVKARFNIGEHTKDPVYTDAERRFQDLERETKKLHDESQKYFDAINGMMKHQIEFSKACAEIYKPISGRPSDPESFLPEGHPEGIEACEEYERLVRELQESLAPELEMIESRIIKPADELMDIIKFIRKTAAKRDHKQLDYDRRRATLKKLEDKKEKTLKDEKAMYRAESEVEAATTDFNYFNDLLKTELPELFRLERDFIQPLFQSFYYMQLNVFYTLHEKMQDIDIGYFDLTKDIEEGFEAKGNEAREMAEQLTITHFKTTGGMRKGQSKYGNKPLAITAGSTPDKLAIEDGKTRPAGRRLTVGSTDAPPPYSPGQPISPSPMSAGLIAESGGVGRANSTGGNWGAAAKAKAAPPPPKPKPSRLSGAPAAETVTALYDYEAQAEGDLSFTTGEVIEIITRTQNENEWWQGRIGTRTGQFPGNYVRIN